MRGMTEAFNTLGLVALDQGDYARAALDDDLFAAAWAAGRSLSLEQAIDEALRGKASHPYPS